MTLERMKSRRKWYVTFYDSHRGRHRWAAFEDETTSRRPQR